LLTLGGFVGGPLAGILIQSLGRKPSAILCSLPYVSGLLVSNTLYVGWAMRLVNLDDFVTI